MERMKIGKIYVMDAKTFKEWTAKQEAREKRWEALMEVRREVLARDTEKA